MLRKLGLICTLLLIPGLALAAGGGRSFSPADFEKIIKDDIKKDFAKKKRKDGAILYDIKDTDYYALYHPEGKFVLFFVQAPIKLSLEQVNNWNRKAIYSRAYMTGKILNFEVPMSFAAGTTPAAVRSYYGFLEKEWNEFKESVKGGD
jgi:hypothetical protein